MYRNDMTLTSGLSMLLEAGEVMLRITIMLPKHCNEQVEQQHIRHDHVEGQHYYGQLRMFRTQLHVWILLVQLPVFDTRLRISYSKSTNTESDVLATINIDPN